MPTNNWKQLKIWKIAHDYLQALSQAYKARGENSKSMTAIASEAILSIPMPNGSKPEPCPEPTPCPEEEKP